MNSIKKLTNYLLLIGGVVTALSGIFNTAMDMYDRIKEESSAGSDVSSEYINDSEAAVADDAAAGMAPEMTNQSVVEQMPTMAAPSSHSHKKKEVAIIWIVASIVGILSIGLGWFLHKKNVRITTKEE